MADTRQRIFISSVRASGITVGSMRQSISRRTPDPSEHDRGFSYSPYISFPDLDNDDVSGFQEEFGERARQILRDLERAA